MLDLHSKTRDMTVVRELVSYYILYYMAPFQRTIVLCHNQFTFHPKSNILVFTVISAIKRDSFYLVGTIVGRVRLFSVRVIYSAADARCHLTQ